MSTSFLSPSRRKAVLTSLSACGAVLAANSNTQAEIIATPVDMTVGFGGGSELASYTFNQLPGGTFTLSRTSTHAIVIGGGTNPLKLNFRLQNGFVANGGAGKFYTSIGNGGGNGGPIASRTITGPLNSKFGASLGYIAFTFSPTVGTTDYGYIAGTLTDGTFAGLAFNIQSIAYDDTGVRIAMGAVPEPSSLVLSAIGALVMGAAGVRKWKQDKAAAKAAPLD
jgi:PEP-CTERM motif